MVYAAAAGPIADLKGGGTLGKNWRAEQPGLKAATTLHDVEAAADGLSLLTRNAWAHLDFTRPKSCSLRRPYRIRKRYLPWANNPSQTPACRAMRVLFFYFLSGGYDDGEL